MKRRFMGLVAIWVALLMLLSIPSFVSAVEGEWVYILDSDATITVGENAYDAVSYSATAPYASTLSQWARENGPDPNANSWALYLVDNRGGSGSVVVRANVGTIAAGTELDQVSMLSDMTGAYDNDDWNAFAIQAREDAPIGPGGGSALPSYTVTFMGYGDFVYTTKSVQQNAQVIKPQNIPTVSGFTFTQWFADQECTNPFDFTTRIVEDTVIYSGWEEYKPETPKAPEGGIVVGEGTETYSPSDNQIVIMLGENTMQVFGRTVELDVPATMVDGVPVLPVRAILDEIGIDGAALYEWTNEAPDALSVHTPIGTFEVANGSNTATLTTGNTQVQMIGNAVKINDRFMLPYNAYTSLFGISVQWNDHANRERVTITVNHRVAPAAASESRIRDVDMAEEMMNYTKSNLLVQSSQQVLENANEVPQGALELLE